MDRRLVAAGLLVSLLTVACGGPGSTTGSAEAGSGGGSDQVPAADPSFPVTVEHRHGETTLEEEPERVVTVGLTDHDAFLALGVVPVGVIDWYGGHDHGVWPWAQDELGDAEPTVIGTSTEIDFEAVASLDPDVIVGLYAGLTEDEYDTLSQIAPVVAQPADHPDWGVPWQEQTRIAGQVVGRVDEAGRAVDEVEQRVAAAREEHPEFVGAEAAIGTVIDGIYVYSPNVGIVRIVRDLGFEVPGEIADLVGDADGATLSLERVEVLDNDAMVWLDAPAGEGPLGEDLYTSLDVHTEGREVHLATDDEIGGAGFVSVLSLPVILDALVPKLDAAIDGDPATDPAAARAAAFPVTIEHALGEATIPDEPERVVSIGFVDHDPLLALGVTPVAVRDWFGEQPYATWPWAQDELGDAEPEVLPAGELDLERIAALRPDLIVGIGFGITDELYARLSEIAPTLARPADHVDYGVPWQESTQMIGRAVGRLDRAEELIADVEERFAAVREAHPEFEDATAVMGLVGNKNGEYSAYGPHDVRGRFLQDLGFSLPQPIVDAAGDSFFASISRERVEVFDADLVLWAVAGPDQVAMVEEDAIYQNLDVARQGRDVFVEYVPLGGALSFSTVLSLPMALDLVVPRIEAALDGDPATSAESGGDA